MFWRVYKGQREGQMGIQKVINNPRSALGYLYLCYWTPVLVPSVWIQSLCLSILALSHLSTVNQEGQLWNLVCQLAHTSPVIHLWELGFSLGFDYRTSRSSSHLPAEARAYSRIWLSLSQTIHTIQLSSGASTLSSSCISPLSLRDQEQHSLLNTHWRLR